MSRRLLPIILLCALPIAVSAQSDSVLHRDFATVAASSPWLTAPNAAGLTRLAAPSLSRAELSVDYGKGGFVNYYESPRSLTLGAMAESYQRLSPRAVVYGLISYENFSGHDMTGSVFIDPSQKPIDIVEDSLTNQGKKHRDTYHLIGALGYDLTSHLSLGARFDFTAANYAKYRDLRHQNKLTDITATAGLLWAPASWLALGAHYSYRRDIESVLFRTYGKTDRTYISLLSYGGFIGQTDQFATTGFTGSDTEKPLFDDRQGFGVELDIKPIGRLTWHNEFRMDYRQGYYGRQSPYSITYTRHRGHDYAYSGQLSWQVQRSLHLLNVNIESSKLRNDMQQYRSDINESGATYYEYYDPVKTTDRAEVTTHIGYEGFLGMRGELPTWHIALGTSLYHRHQTAYRYPYFRRQHWNSTTLYFSGERNVDLRRGVLTLSIDLSYRHGSGAPYEDLTFSQPSDKQHEPASVEAYAQQEYAFWMAPQYQLGGSVGYAFIVPGTRLKGYARLAAHNRHANGSASLYGKDHTTLSCTLGLQF